MKFNFSVSLMHIHALKESSRNVQSKVAVLGHGDVMCILNKRRLCKTSIKPFNPSILLSNCTELSTSDCVLSPTLMLRNLLSIGVRA